MAWIAGIIGLIIVIVYWRIFLPILGIAVLGIGILLYAESEKEKNRKAEVKETKQVIAVQIATAKANASDVDRVWGVWRYEDPASGELVPRTAFIKSNDGLCTLSVEKRITGSELAGLDCPLLKISEYSDIEVKFDNYSTSDTMNLEAYNDSDGVFISTYQSTYNKKLPYKEFVQRLSASKAVSIQIPTKNAGTHWITFSLNGSTEAINAVYAGG